MNSRAFQRTIYSYFVKHGRQLPWRYESDPYKIFVSEVMLQQTQVSRVLAKYPEFIEGFPTFQSLAKAPLRDVLGIWSGLGYNRRAKYLKESAGIIVKEKRYGFMLNGLKVLRFESFKDAKKQKLKGSSDPSFAPHNAGLRRGKHRIKDTTIQRYKESKNADIAEMTELLQELPGIGHATAGAIVAYAFNLPTVFIETNIRAVFLNHFYQDKMNITDRELLLLVEKTLDKKNPRQWYYALTDYGAMLKTREKFKNIQSKHYAKQSKFEGSRRQIRGQVLKTLLKRGPSNLDQIKSYLSEDRRIEETIRDLIREQLIVCDPNTDTYSIPNT